MFGYYGSKSKLAHRYPKPRYENIIEPFAGAARYSLLYAEQRVHINDKYKVVVDIWKWLRKASQEQIEALPELARGEDVRDLKHLPQIERDLLGFCVNKGVAYPHNIVTPWADGRIAQTKRTILKNLDRVRHWKITNLDYRELPDIEATWFIDPPYQKGGHYYPCHEIDYGHLAEWCRSRRGQVIVCENEGATWLPFKPLTQFRGQTQTFKTEMVWTLN